MLNNKRSARILLSESRKSRLYGQFDEYDIAAAIILESQTEIPYELILTEGWFTDKIKSIKKSVGGFLNDKVGEPLKYAWAKNMPQLYSQGTHKFWKRKELAEKAKEEFKKIQDQLDKKFEGESKRIFGDLKTIMKDAESAEIGELGFPNNKKTEEFYNVLFGKSEWEDIEKELLNIESGKNLADAELGGIFGNMIFLKVAMMSDLHQRVLDLESIDERRKEYNTRLEAMRKMLQKYAQDVKEIYQTFESRLHHHSMANLLLESELENVVDNVGSENPKDKEEAIETLEDVLDNAEGISDSQLQSLKKSSSPMNMLIAAVVSGILAALMVKVNSDAHAAWCKKIAENAKKPQDVIPAAAEELKKTFAINDGEGLTQAMGRLTGKNLGPDAKIGDLLNAIKEAGIKPENFEGVMQDPASGFEMLNGADPSQSVGKFFLKASETMSGKTPLSPFMLKKGSVLKWVTKQAAKQTVKAAATTKLAPFTAPIASWLCNSAIAAVPAFLTVAAIRKYKANRKKLILQLIEALDDIPEKLPSEAPSTDAVVNVKKDAPPNIDIDPAKLPPVEAPPKPEEDGEAGCNQDEIGLAKFMKAYNTENSWSTKAGDGKPKKMSTMFDRNGELKKDYEDLSNEKLQQDIEATADAYNKIINNPDMFEVSDDPEAVAAAVREESVSSWKKGDMILEKLRRL